MAKRLTTEEFIERARAVHGDKYNYSKTVYWSTNEDVIITCPIHGDFKQRPTNHLYTGGCRDCGLERRRQKRMNKSEDMLNEMNNIHNNKYEYPDFKYEGIKKDIKIICPIHGKFEQNVGVHLRGSGCRKCVGKDKTTEEFIAESREKFGDLLDYPKTKYVAAKTEVILTCRKHGDFKITPDGHLRKAAVITGGCPDCRWEHISKINTSNTAEFIEKATVIHNNWYDYSLVDYVNNDTKIIIICPEHGKFEQRPANHLDGKGCSRCRGRNQTTEDYVKKIIKVHPDYDYSRTVYTGTNEKITVICPLHGEFYPRAGSHAQGKSRCPTCQNRNIKYLTYVEAKKIVHPLRLNNIREYHQWWEANRLYCQTIGLPKHAWGYYTRNP